MKIFKTVPEWVSVQQFSPFILTILSLDKCTEGRNCLYKHLFRDCFEYFPDSRIILLVQNIFRDKIDNFVLILFTSSLTGMFNFVLILFTSSLTGMFDFVLILFTSSLTGMFAPCLLCVCVCFLGIWNFFHYIYLH